MLKNVKLFKMFGVDVLLNMSWFLVSVLFFTWTDTNMELFLKELTTVMMLFATILLHEFGHILAAKRCGVSTDKVVLHVLGGAAFINTEESKSLTPKQNVWIYFAGPLVNLCIVIISLPILILYTPITTMTTLDAFQSIMLSIIVINSVIFIFNLLPIFPMDGGGILRSFLQHIKVKRYIMISALISIVFCLLLLTFSLMYVAIGGIIISSVFLLYGISELHNEFKPIK